MSSVVPQDPFNEYTGNGVTTVFPFEFQLLSAADLVVTVNGLVVADFVVSGVGAQQGGQITFTLPPAAGARVLLTRTIALRRDIDYQYNGALKESTLDLDFNRLWQALQGVGAFLGGNVRAPFPEQLVALPPASARANTILTFDPAGQPWVQQLTGLSVVVGDMSATVIRGDGVTNNAAAWNSANSVGKPVATIGVSHVTSPVTITVPLVDTLKQIFTPTSLVTIDNGLPVRPEWFGAVTGGVGLIRYAVNALPAKGGVVKLECSDYRSGYDTAVGTMFDNRGGTPGVDYMIKSHVTIQGARLPEYAADSSRLQFGTRVVGMMYVSSEAQGFAIDKVGFDGGPQVYAAYPQYQAIGGCEGLCYLQANKATPVYGTNVRIGRVIALCRGGGAVTDHGILLEAIDGGEVEYAEGRGALHGVVIKSRNMRCGQLVGSLNRGEDVIIKADAYALMENVAVDSVITSGAGGGDPGFGLLVLAETASAGTVNIGTVQVLRKAYGVRLQGTGANVLADVNIGSITTQSCPVGYELLGNVFRSLVGTALINASTNGVVVGGSTTDIGNAIELLSVNNTTRAVDVTGKIRLGQVAVNGATFALYHRANAARILLGGSVVTTAVSNLTAVDVPTLANAWTSVSTSFRIEAGGGNWVARGRISGGTADLICTLAEPYRPTRTLTLSATGLNGATTALCPVTVNTDGTVVVSNRAAAATYLSLDGVQWPMAF